MEDLGIAVGNYPLACVDDVDGVWVTAHFFTEHAGQRRFLLCIKVFSQISIYEIFQKLFTAKKKPAIFGGLFELTELLLDHVNSDVRSYSGKK